MLNKSIVFISTLNNQVKKPRMAIFNNANIIFLISFPPFLRYQCHC